jgi:hypothetical protein
VAFSVHSSARITLVAAALSGGCDGGEPELQPILDQVCHVGEEVRVIVVASDPDGDRLHFDFHSTIRSMNEGGRIGILPSGAAEFRWRPDAADVGVGYVDFLVSDGVNTASQTVRIDVRSAGGEGARPMFVRPEASGIVLVDFVAGSPYRLELLVEDADSTEVSISQEPFVHGSVLSVRPGSGGKRATWTWTPNEIEIRERSAKVVSFRVSDGESQLRHLDYAIFFRGGPGEFN